MELDIGKLYTTGTLNTNLATPINSVAKPLKKPYLIIDDKISKPGDVFPGRKIIFFRADNVTDCRI